MSEATRADICVVACAEAWRGDGEIVASPIGTIPMIAVRLAASTFEPDLVYSDGDALALAEPIAVNAAPDAPRRAEAWMPFGKFFDIVWSGKRHVMMGATQIDRFGNQNIACIGPWAKPKAMLLGVRGGPGNTVNHPTSYWIPNHSTRSFVPQVDCVSGVGYDRVPKGAEKFHEIRRVVSNLGVFDFETPDHSMRLRSVHPGVTVDEIVEATGFELNVPADVPESRPPTDEELKVIESLDPDGLRLNEVKG
ncbi:MAG: CoA-transferase [Actinobacteria bacterium]|nr:CoA-transferase [Actinomycetota bacterium]